MSGGAAEVGASVTTGSKDGVVCAESVERSIFLVVSHYPFASPILHDQIKCEVLYEVVGVVSQGLSVECMK